METVEIRLTYAWLLLAAAVALVLFTGYGGYRYYLLHQLADAQAAQIQGLESGLSDASTTNATLEDSLTQEKDRNDAFASQITDISGTVGTLNKLANTDPQLLAKYSKVYFLNENYVPSSLSDIPAEDTYDTTRTYQFHTQALPHLEALISDAKDDGVTIQVISAYRSFGTQAALKSEYKTTYGSGADTFSADQGYSEHQLGTAVDFTTTSVGATFSGFSKTDAYAWLVKNGYKYGFILSYPPDNAYYVYEPWHWRFVGVALATRLHDDNEYFYDLDQRTINTYLVDIFD